MEARSRASFIENGLELATIRDGGDYKAEYGTFKSYVEKRWEMSEAHVYRLMDAAEFAQKLSNWGVLVPIRESHVRLILEEEKIENDEERQEVWAEAVALAEGKMTAKDVSAAVAKFAARKDKDWFTLAEWVEEQASNTFSERFLGLRHDKAKLNRQDSASIEWAQWSWNPVTGCKHDCPYCYARDIADRFYPQRFEPSIYPWRRPNTTWWPRP